jgi:hypothetical protein
MTVVYSRERCLALRDFKRTIRPDICVPVNVEKGSAAQRSIAAVAGTYSVSIQVYAFSYP